MNNAKTTKATAAKATAKTAASPRRAAGAKAPARRSPATAKPARAPKPAKAAAVAPAARETLRCLCGCGASTKGGRYLPGHDARHASKVAELMAAEADENQWSAIAAANRLISPALILKATDAAERIQTKAAARAERIQDETEARDGLRG